MAGDSQSSVKFVIHLPINIDIVKFDGTNNFDMWRCEVMDVLTTSNLCLKEKPAETSEKDWDKKNQMTCGTSDLI